MWTERAGVRMTATFHPAALLRNAEYRAPAIEDLILIRQEAEALGARVQ
jgi:uracil-DNA glycosylase